MKIELKNILNVDIDLQMKLREWRNSEDISKFFIIDHITEKQHRNWIDKNIKGETNRAYIIYVDNTPAGCAYFLNIDNNLKIAEWGLYLYPLEKYIGKGIGSQVIYLLNEAGFNELKIDAIEIKVINTNLKAQELYKKFGFKLKNSYKDSTSQKLVHKLRLNKEEWHRIKAKFTNYTEVKHAQ